jgi:hypothetical protein
MSETPSIGAFAIVPSNNLPAAVPFWERLGFNRTGGGVNYIVMTGWGCEVHLVQAGDGPWRVPEKNNPFGVFIRCRGHRCEGRRPDHSTWRRLAASRMGSIRGRNIWTGRTSRPRRLALQAHCPPEELTFAGGSTGSMPDSTSQFGGCRPSLHARQRPSTLFTDGRRRLQT